MKRLSSAAAITAACLICATYSGIAAGASDITNNGSANSTTITTTIPEQVRMNIDGIVEISFTDRHTGAVSDPIKVEVDDIVLSSGNVCQLWITPGSDYFTSGPGGEETLLPASYISWIDTGWSSGASGTVSPLVDHSTPVLVATSAVNAVSFKNTAFRFILRGDDTIKLPAMDCYALALTWSCVSLTPGP